VNQLPEWYLAHWLRTRELSTVPNRH
jgi:hypothetical protein